MPKRTKMATPFARLSLLAVLLLLLSSLAAGVETNRSAYTGDPHSVWMIQGPQAHPREAERVATTVVTGFPPASSSVIPTTQGLGSWVNVSQFIVGGPGPRDGAYFEYDPTQGQVILAGGYDLSRGVALGDTWGYRAGSWTNLTSFVQPPPQLTGGFAACDAFEGYTLEFGGSPWTSFTDSNYTWSYANGSWTNLTAIVGQAPPPTDNYFAEMAYDAADREVVLLERNSLYGVTSPVETWTYSAGRWTNITATAGVPPVGTTGGALVYDTADGYLVQVGGSNLTSNGQFILENGTWAFRNGTWSEILPLSGSPSPRVFSPVVYDPSLNALVLFGGVGNPGGNTTGSQLSVNLNDTWLFSKGNWTNSTSSLASHSPMAVFTSTMVYDEADGYVLYLGYGEFGYQDTWLLGDPPPFVQLNVTPAAIEVNETFTLRTTTASGSGPLSFDYSGLPPGCSTLNSSVLSCSSSSAGTFPVTVTVTDPLQRSTAVHLNLTIQPGPSVAGFTIAPAEVHVGATVQFTVNVSNGFAPFTFSYTGLPSGCPDQNSSAFSCAIGVAGTYGVTVNVTDSIGLEAIGQGKLGAYDLPRVSAFSASPAWIDLGDNVTFQVTVVGGAPPLSFTFGSLPAGCTPASNSTGDLTCVPAFSGDFVTTVTVLDGLGAEAGPATAQLHVQPDPSLSGLTATPDPVEVGGTLELNATLIGGTAPFTISWSGLPSGCASSTLRFNCTPGASGTFNVSVTATDSLGHTANQTISLEVATPSGGSETANLPLLLVVGVTVVAVAAATGGVIAYRRRRNVKAESQSEPPSED